MAGIAAAIFLRAPGKQASPDPLADAVSSRKTVAEGQGARGEGPAQEAGEETKPGAATTGPLAPPRDPATGLPVKASRSPQADSVAEAFRTKRHPERLSMLIAPKPFDKAAFEADPDAYLKTIEPGRVMQGLQPGKDVPALRAQGEHQFSVKPAGKVVLEVQGERKAPVTFLSVDGGRFAESDLNCVTVRADERGVAKATFVASFGADGDVNILAGSPEASGQVRFVVMVESSPLRRADEDAGKTGQE